MTGDQPSELFSILYTYIRFHIVSMYVCIRLYYILFMAVRHCGNFNGSGRGIEYRRMQFLMFCWAGQTLFRILLYYFRFMHSFAYKIVCSVCMCAFCSQAFNWYVQSLNCMYTYVHIVSLDFNPYIPVIVFRWIGAWFLLRNSICMFSLLFFFGAPILISFAKEIVLHSRKYAHKSKGFVYALNALLFVHINTAECVYTYIYLCEGTSKKAASVRDNNHYIIGEMMVVDYAFHNPASIILMMAEIMRILCQVLEVVNFDDAASHSVRVDNFQGEESCLTIDFCCI